MEEKDYIKDLFQNRFQDFESDVDPNIWSNIQSEISSTPISPTSSLGLSSKTIIIASIITSAAILSGGYFMISKTTISTNNTASYLTPKPKTESNIIIENKSNTQKFTPTITKEQEIATKTIKKENHTSNTSPISSPKPEIKNPNTQFKHNNVTKVEDTEDQPQLNEKENKPIISKAPESINIAKQSRVIASPMGGVAPLKVQFHVMTPVNKIKWQFDDGNESGELEPSHTFEKPGIYIVTMIAQLANGSPIVQKAIIEVKPTPINPSLVSSSFIRIPNVFTPNNDNQNDKLIIETKHIIEFTISIYSVSGKLVYTSNNSEKQWDGTNLQGDKVQDGTYYYLVNAIGEDHNVYVPKGYITILTE